MTAAWIAATAPASNRPEDVEQFFGVPPDPRTQLAENVAKKRRVWTMKASGRGNRAKAEQVLELVTRLGEAVLRGSVLPDAGPMPDRDTTAHQVNAETVEDLWRQLDRLLLNSHYGCALTAARHYRQQWAHDPELDAVLGHVVAVGAAAAGIVDRPTLTEGLDAAVRYTRARPASPDAWGSAATIAAALGDTAAVTDLVTRATEQFEVLPGPLRGPHLDVLADRPDDEVLQLAVTYVHDADPTTRAAVAAAVTTRAASVLPLTSKNDVRRYRRTVTVAAWCANGVADAELAVRPHRLWAEHAGTRVHLGSPTIRSAVAAATLGLGVPILNLIRSKPAWKLLDEGPAEDANDDVRAAHAALRAAPYVAAVHAGRPVPTR